MLVTHTPVCDDFCLLSKTTNHQQGDKWDNFFYLQWKDFLLLQLCYKMYVNKRHLNGIKTQREAQ